MAKRAAIILAGGESRRMNSRLSKVLHSILGWPVIRHVIETAREAGVADVVLVANESNAPGLRELVADLEGRFEVVIQPVAKGTADAVRCGLAGLPDDADTAVVLCGDAPLIRPETLRDFLDAHESGAAVVSVLSGLVANPYGYGRIVRDADGAFTGIVEEKDADEAERAITEINSGCLAFRSAELPALLEAVPSAPNGELYLTRTVDIAVERGLATAATRRIEESELLGINTRAQLAEATAVLRRRVIERHLAAGVTVVDPSSTFIDRRARIGRDAVIEPFTVIEGPVELGEGCHVGPFARVRGASRLAGEARVGNFVEVVRSELGAGATALHHAYIGDATVGAGANIGAGVVVANWDGERKHSATIEAGSRIGAGTIIVSPATVGAGAVTGAGAVVTKDIPAGETRVGVPARRHQPERAGEEARS